MKLTSMRLGGIVANIGFLTIVVGCNNSHHTPRYTQQAGVGQKAMGVIVRRATSDDIKVLNSKDGVAFRKLYGGDVEVSGLTEEEIRGLLPKASLKRNKYYANLLPLKDQDRDLTSAVLSAEGQPFDIRSCRKLPSPPVPSVSITKNKDKLAAGQGIIDIDDGAVELSAKGSKPGIQTTKPLEIMWAVMGPEGSKFERYVSAKEDLSITPDELGGYMIFLVLKDERDGCSMGRLMFGVTHNEAFQGPSAPRAFTAADLKTFAHLAVIGADKAWQYSRGRGVKVAILDSGVNYNHPDLRANIALNTAETPGNGIDDDHNGLVDDVYGYDFNRGDNMPFDDNRHGTHVAGIAASAVTGVAPEAQILPIKIGDPFGGGDLASIESGIRYAVDQGARVINMSFGGEAKNVPRELVDAAAYAESHGVLMVIAAGNGDPETGEGFDIDTRPVMPAGMTNDNILSVAATKLSGGLTRYSNFGVVGVDVAAPGGDRDDGPIWAAGFHYQKDMYLGLGGTSMASPVVAGVAALVMSANNSVSGVTAKRIIMMSSEQTPALKGKTASGGQATALGAVTMAKTGHSILAVNQ